jgi:hypothetical protein
MITIKLVLLKELLFLAIINPIIILSFLDNALVVILIFHPNHLYRCIELVHGQLHPLGIGVGKIG